MAPLDQDIIDMLATVGQGGPLLKGWTIPGGASLEGNRIRFHRPTEERTTKFVEPSEWGLAGEFAALSDLSPGLIAEFANEWGPLRVCRHGIRHWGSERCRLREYQKNGELLASWRRHANGVKSMLRAGIALQKGLPMERNDWWNSFRPVTSMNVPVYMESHPLPWEFYTGASEFDLGMQRRALLEVINQWVECLGMRPQMTWYEGEATPSLYLSQGSLLECVVAQVLFALTGTCSLETCTSCGQIYTPKRTPRSGEYHYCSSCGRKAAVRDAGRRWRPLDKDRREKDAQDG